MKYSVVIPMYNNQDTILKTLQSVVDQTKYNLISEIIIVDDGSTDNSALLVEEFYSKNSNIFIKLIKKHNGGAASARNIGIKAAKNNYIALLDADDIWLPQKIEIQNEIIEKNREIKALGSNREGEIISRGVKITDTLYRLSPFQYCIKNWPCTPSLIFDKNVFQNDEYFDETLTHAEEGLFFLDLSVKCGLYYCLDVLVSCGDGKPAYGYSGLSANLKKMHEGVNKMMYLALQKKYLSYFQYYILKIYEFLKYIRRKIIVRKRKGYE